MLQLQKLRIDLCNRLIIYNFLNFVTRILQYECMVRTMAINCTHTFLRDKTIYTFEGYSSRTEIVLNKKGNNTS